MGNAINDVDLKGVFPITLVALTAMTYICAKRNIPRLGHIGKYTCRCDSRLSIWDVEKFIPPESGPTRAR